MRSWFYKKDHPKSLAEKEMGKVKFFGSNRRNKREKKSFPFVITYHSSLKSIGKIINQNLFILHVNEEVKSVFRPAPITFFRSMRKLSSYLVRAKLYSLKEPLVQFYVKRNGVERFIV